VTGRVPARDGSSGRARCRKSALTSPVAGIAGIPTLDPEEPTTVLRVREPEHAELRASDRPHQCDRRPVGLWTVSHASQRNTCSAVECSSLAHMPGARLDLALERMTSGDWATFERFAAEFLARIGPHWRSSARVGRSQRRVPPCDRRAGSRAAGVDRGRVGVGPCEGRLPPSAEVGGHVRE